MTAEQAAEALTAAYQAEVEYRRMEYKPDAYMADNIRRVACALTADKPPLGLMLCGTPGNGKTTMLLALQALVRWAGDIGLFGEDRVAITVVDAVQAAQQSREPRTFTQTLSRPVLAIEDIGREPAELLDYGNAISPVTSIIEHRYAEQLFTIITTNLTPKEVRSRYGDRVADRLNEMMQVIVFRNPTYRKN